MNSPSFACLLDACCWAGCPWPRCTDGATALPTPMEEGMGLRVLAVLQEGMCLCHAVQHRRLPRAGAGLCLARLCLLRWMEAAGLGHEGPAGSRARWEAVFGMGEPSELQPRGSLASGTQQRWLPGSRVVCALAQHKPPHRNQPLLPICEQAQEGLRAEQSHGDHAAVLSTKGTVSRMPSSPPGWAWGCRVLEHVWGAHCVLGMGLQHIH